MSAQPIKIAILAMGGEGGGVLADWIVDLGETNGYIAQTTSVPGVAQRTGATIYYVELFPTAAARRDGGRPVLALMPLPGDVDVVLASELMEAGRAVQRGLVTADRTTLIASSHRVYSIAEKTAMADGRADANNLLAHAEAAAKRFICFDMAQLAEQNGSVISAVLFGALAGCGVLPFSRAEFEATVARGGVGVKSSLKAFGAAFDDVAQADAHRAAPGASAATDLSTGSAAPMDASAGPPAGEAPARAPATAAAEPAGAPATAAVEAHEPREPRVRALVSRMQSRFPHATHAILREGLRRVVDYQDPDYGTLYLDRLERLQRNVGVDAHLLAETGRHLALWMSYEDTIRVADLKTRATRFDRVGAEVRLKGDQLLAISEFMHPRVEEIADTLPASLGRWLLGSGAPRRLVERFTNKGRVITTTSLSGFLLLYTLAGMRRWRRASLRFQVENARIESWLARIDSTARQNPQLALEVAHAQRLVKGYGDTHARGWRNFETVMAEADRAGSTMTPARLRELRDAALADEHGTRLRALLGAQPAMKEAA